VEKVADFWTGIGLPTFDMAIRKIEIVRVPTSVGLPGWLEISPTQVVSRRPLGISPASPLSWLEHSGDIH